MDGQIAYSSYQKAGLSSSVAVGNGGGARTSSASIENGQTPVTRWRRAVAVAVSLVLVVGASLCYRRNDVFEKRLETQQAIVSLGLEDVPMAPSSSTRLQHILSTLHTLESRLDGDIYYQYNETGFDKASLVWCVASLVDPPLAVIEVAHEHDVQLAVPVLADLSRNYDFPFRVRSGGHHKMGYSTVAQGAVLSLVRLNHFVLSEDDINMNATTAIATIGPALTVSEYIDTALLKYSYGGVVGFCLSVAEGGFLLGGGFGMQSRLYGLGADNVVGFRIVLADGSAHRVDADHNRELFWALRGSGGGNFGVVTEIEYQIHRSSDRIHYTTLTFPDPSPVEYFLHRLGQAEPSLPRNLVVMFDLVDTVTFLWTGRDASEAEGGEKRMRALLPQFLPPELQHRVGDQLTFEKGRWSNLDGTESDSNRAWTQNVWGAACWCGFLLPENNTLSVWEEIIRYVGAGVEASSPHLLPDIELWGGAIGDTAWNETAFPYRSAIFNVGVLLVIPDDEPNADVVFKRESEVVDKWWPMVAQYLTGSYVNYPMASLVGKNHAETYWADNLPRLAGVKSAVDPDNVFRHPLSVPLDEETIS